jgi:aryl-alcohol dehydrogenase-like predicted oxidoreductase
VQDEYSLWARDVEAEVLPVCEELCIGFVPWSPLGQGFLTGKVDPTTGFDKSDVRSWFPRFTPEAMQANQAPVDLLNEIAKKKRPPPHRSRWHGFSPKSRGSCRFPVPESCIGSMRTWLRQRSC